MLDRTYAQGATMTQQGRGTWIIVRWTVAAVAILVAVASACAAAVANWVTRDLADTPSFISALAPLANNAKLQDAIVSQVGDLAEQYVVDNPVTESLGGLAAQAAQSALDWLPFDLGIDAEGVVQQTTAGLAETARGAAEDATWDFLRSPVFPTLTDQVLSDTHGQVMAAISGPASGNTEFAEIYLRLGPILETLKAQESPLGRLIVGFVPSTDRQIPIFRINDLSTVRSAYGWFSYGPVPYLWATAVATAAALLVAPRRWPALIVLGGTGAAVSAWFSGQVSATGGRLFVGLSPETREMAQDLLGRLTTTLDGSLYTILCASVVIGVVAVVGLLLTWVWGRGRAPSPGG